MKKIAIILVLLFLCVILCSSAGCTTIANTFDPVLGNWESSLAMSYFDLTSNGKGTKTELGTTSAIEWNKVGDGAYNIDGARYTLNGNILQGEFTTYHKL